MSMSSVCPVSQYCVLVIVTSNTVCGGMEYEIPLLYHFR